MVKYTDYNVALTNLENWLLTQPHLPVIKPCVLEMFIHATEGDLEVAKNIIDLQYCMRNNWTDIFLHRDPNARTIRKIYDVVDILLLPGLTPEGWKITLMRLADYDSDKFMTQDALKLFLMLYDARMNTEDPDGISKGEQVIFDAKGFTLKHLAKVNLTCVRVFSKFNQDAASTKLRDIHILNCPPFLDKIIALFRPFIADEIYALIKFHQPNSTTFDDYTKSKDILPKEYGGKADVPEIKKEILKIMLSQRDYLMDKKYWVTDEKKRPANQPKPLELEACGLIVTKNDKMVLCKNIDESLAVIQKWALNNSTLPKIEPMVLKHFVNVCEGNIQETEKLIKLHYTVRNNYSNLFIERDPLDQGSQIIQKASDVIFLPKLTPDNYVIQISRIADPDPDKYLFVESVKNCAMFYDLLLYTLTDKDEIIDGIISIFDAKGFSLKHIAKVNFAAFRGFVKFFEKTIAFKIRQIHIINCPPHINKILSLCKPFLSEHVNKMINLHESNSETLFKYIPKDLLPVEINGTASYSIESLKQKQIQDLKDYRNYLIDPSYWKMKGDLSKNDNDAANGIEGSFKTLSFD